MSPARGMGGSSGGRSGGGFGVGGAGGPGAGAGGLGGGGPGGLGGNGSGTGAGSGSGAGPGTGVPARSQSSHLIEPSNPSLPACLPCGSSDQTGLFFGLSHRAMGISPYRGRTNPCLRDGRNALNGRSGFIVDGET